MVVCFDVIFDDDLIRRLELEKKKNVYISSYSETVKELKKFLNDKIKIKIENKLINGKDVQNSWFPDFKETKIDVFLSHSHQDIEYVRSFAGWLKKELDVTAFIDSDLWHNIKDLERDLGKDLNKEKYIKGIKFYDYDNTRLMLQHTNNMALLCTNPHLSLFLPYEYLDSLMPSNPYDTLLYVTGIVGYDPEINGYHLKAYKIVKSI